jgi:hypothetical protein
MDRRKRSRWWDCAVVPMGTSSPTTSNKRGKEEEMHAGWIWIWPPIATSVCLRIPTPSCFSYLKAPRQVNYFNRSSPRFVARNWPVGPLRMRTADSTRWRDTSKIKIVATNKVISGVWCPLNSRIWLVQGVMPWDLNKERSGSGRCWACKKKERVVC